MIPAWISRHTDPRDPDYIGPDPDEETPQDAMEGEPDYDPDDSDDGLIDSGPYHYIPKGRYA